MIFSHPYQTNPVIKVQFSSMQQEEAYAPEPNIFEVNDNVLDTVDLSMETVLKRAEESKEKAIKLRQIELSKKQEYDLNRFKHDLEFLSHADSEGLSPLIVLQVMLSLMEKEDTKVAKRKSKILGIVPRRQKKLFPNYWIDNSQLAGILKQFSKSSIIKNCEILFDRGIIENSRDRYHSLRYYDSSYFMEDSQKLAFPADAIKQILIDKKII